MQEKLIKLIIAIDKVYDDYYCDCGCDDYLINEFEENLNIIFKDSINEDIFSYISSLDTAIFTDKFYMTEEYLNNKIRKQIEEYINNNKVKEKIILDYELVYKYIQEDYKLISYLNSYTSEQLISIASINPYVLFLVDTIKEDDLTQILKNNSTTSLVIDYNILRLADEYSNSYLIKNKDKLLKNREIYNLYIDGLKKYLGNKELDYIYVSNIAKNDIELAKYVLKINSKLLVYTGDNIKNNKEIMTDMIKLDKDNSYYLGEELKKEENGKLIEIIMNSYPN